MTKLAEQLKQGADQAWESLADGWRELSARASGALTRLWPVQPSESAPPPRSASAPDEGLPPPGGWAFMASDVLDDDDALWVRIEAPGMRREDFDIELHHDTLAVWGEKRFDRELAAGRLNVVQCAYGRFRREVRLPVPVKSDQATATYRDGVLRIRLPKAEGARVRRIAVNAT